MDHHKNLLDGSPEALCDSINHTFIITVNYDCIPLNSLDIFLVSADILWIPYQSHIFLVLTAYALKIKIFDHQKNLLDGLPEALWDSINHTFRITVIYGLIVSLWIPWIFFLFLYKGVYLKQMFPSNPLVPPKNHSKQLSFTMALKLLASLPIYNFSRVLVSSKDPISLVTSRTRNGYLPRPVQCMPANKVSNSPDILRRSANYQPSIWNHDYIESLTNEYVVRTLCYYCFVSQCLVLSFIGFVRWQSFMYSHFTMFFWVKICLSRNYLSLVKLIVFGLFKKLVKWEV